MATAYLQGPDIVEVSFSTDVQQLTALGTTITGKTILEISYIDNTVTYRIEPPVLQGDPNLTYQYNGTGNLVSLPTYANIDVLNEVVINNIQEEYIKTLDGFIISGPDNDNYHIYNHKLYPENILETIEDDFIETLAGNAIIVETDIDNWLVGTDDDVILVGPSEALVINPSL